MLRISSRRFKTIVGCVAAVAALSVTGVSSAAAAPAAFNLPAGGGVSTSLAGSLSVTNGLQSTSCTFSFARSSASNNAAMEGSMTGATGMGTEAKCANGGQLSLSFVAAATKSAGAFTLTNTWSGSSSTGKNPFGGAGSGYYSAPYSASFVNGAGSTASQIVLNETVLGSIFPGGGTLKATGSLSVRKADGSLLTLS